jgi:hypothetical protein
MLEIDDNVKPYSIGLEIISAIGLIFYILWYGTVFEASYPDSIVELYGYPYWRLFLLLLVLVITNWSPRVGLLAAFALLLYLSDMKILTEKVYKTNKNEKDKKEL